MSLPAKAAVAFGCTFVMALGAPHDGITPLVWLGYAPLTFAVRRFPCTNREAFFLGWMGGLCAGLMGFPWIAELLQRFASLPAWLAYVLLGVFSAWTAIPYGLWAMGVRLFPAGTWRGLGWACVLWVALAAAWPAVFPYTVAIGFAEMPVWIQAAELFGVAGVEIQVVACGVCLAEAVCAREPRRRARWAVLAVAVPVLSAALGAWRMNALDRAADEARVVRFGLVQPNNPVRWPDRTAKMERLWSQSARAQELGAQVVVWPEAGVYPYRIARPFTGDSPDPKRKVLARHRLPTIFGAASGDPGEGRDYNSVFLMGADGVVHGTFDKVNLMPFGEYVPIVDPEWAQSHIPTMSHIRAGKGPVRFTVEQPDPGLGPVVERFSLAPLVCYEDIFADFAREAAAVDGGVELFGNLTIDTWFGVTDAPWEHLALAQFRSVEHRLPMVRSVSAGVTAVVDQCGRVVAHLGVTGPTIDRPLSPELLVHDVALTRNSEEHPTVYARGGWAFVPLCQALVVLVVLNRLRRRFSPVTGEGVRT